MAEAEKCDLDDIVNAFLTDVESIRTSATITGVMVTGLSQFIAKKFNEFLFTCEKVEGKENSYKIPAEKFYRHKKLEEEHRRGTRATEIVPRSLLVALISQYDAFLSGLVRALFIHQPSLIKSSNRTIEFSEILKFSSIEEAKSAVMDAELESLLRDSHHEQFIWLENRFELRTLREFPAWKNFVELTQRRNLFVHTNGKVSKQYIKVCQENGVELKGINIGDQLEADSSYVRKSADTLLEVAVKLSQVLWRKTLPSQLAEADESLVSITYDLLERKRYGLSIILLDFAFDVVKRYSSTDVRLRLLINRANAYRLSGNLRRCAELVGGEDWQAYDPSFRLAAHILKK